MTKEEFIVYVKAIIDMEIEVAKRTNPIFPKDERYKTVEGLKEFVTDPAVASQEPQYELIGALKLIEEALNKVNQLQPQPSYPISPNLNPPFVPGIAVPLTVPYRGGNELDWTYRPEHQPYYTVTCTTNTTQQK
jgi:hypothetical protein